MTSHFEFLKDEWPELFDSAIRAESSLHSDPRAACFYARRTLELAVHWLYKHDSGLSLPYQDHLSALIHEPTFRSRVGDTIFAKIRLLKDLGNQAVHSRAAIRAFDAITALRELFHVSYWLAHTYARGAKPPWGARFNPDAIPQSVSVTPQTLDQLQRLQTQLQERDAKLSELLSDRTALDEELLRLRAEVAEAKIVNAAQPDNHDYSEAETRDFFIDLLLKEAGWPLDEARDREYEVDGMPNNQSKGYVDYVLWGDDGIPLGLVEAKRTKRDSRIGQQQAKLYADCLEARFGRRPIIFYSNGYDHWIWDDVNYPPRSIQGFYKKDELQLLIQRRTSRTSLVATPINNAIVERHYQNRAIRRIAEAFENHHDRKALVVMATGAGKTRTVIALVDLLMRCNWVKRVLFLADRVELVKQAVGEFKKHLAHSSPVNLVTEPDGEGRVYGSTYPTIMNMIDETKNGQRRFAPGHFDLVIIDEAHRSVFKKYKAIFEYFDSLLVGLTATPKNEIDRNTYRLFDLENGVPTDHYSLEEAVEDGFLVPARPISVPIKFQRTGINYDELSEEEKDEWDNLEWNDESGIPRRVEPEAVNKWLFNKDTVDKVLEHLMMRGVKVAGGDRLGKTIIFAKNQAHADFIGERFNVHYPNYRGDFARVITFQTTYAGTLIDKFKVKDSNPHLAISVDMLDTGLDVPEVVNLVFFKVVHSKTKFWQMVGRGTRLCPGLFGPSDDKKFFCIFDYCGNLEFFGQNPNTVDGAAGDSLSQRIFTKRVELIDVLDHGQCPSVASDPVSELELRKETAELLRTQVAAMNVHNFVVRPKRMLVEKYAKEDAWQQLNDQAIGELTHEVAGLPTELDPEGEEAKRFDLLMLRLQLGLLRVERGFPRLRDQLKEIASLLEEKSSIPMVHEQMELIQELQTDEWWQDVTAPILETVRKRLRSLVQFIDRASRQPIYSDFEDIIGTETEVTLPGFGNPADFERYKSKTRAFLRQHQDHPIIKKVRTNQQLRETDLAELEQLFLVGGLGAADNIARAKTEANGLGRFVRSMVGLDREAAKQAFASFLTGKNLSANQIEFIDMIINHLTDRGTLDVDALYSTPFVDITPTGPDGIFSSRQVDELIAIIRQINDSALAA